MASSQPAAKPAKPLAMMTRLSPLVSYYKPPSTAAAAATGGSPASGTVAAPKLIVVASWMDAQDAHIAKYIAFYQSIYPTSTILLTKFRINLAWSAAARRRAVQPAAAFLRAQVDSGALTAAPREPEILVHVFSNGGAASMEHLYQIYRRKTGHALPPHAAVYDSNPGRTSATRTYNAFMAGVRGAVRFLVGPLVAIFSVVTFLMYGPLKFLFGEGPLREAQRVHNDRALVRQTNRSYIYSKEDSMVDWRHVEEHAAEANAKGIPSRTERYENTAHVAHMRTDPGRYWKIVTDTWEEAIRRSGTLLPGFT